MYEPLRLLSGHKVVCKGHIISMLSEHFMTLVTEIQKNIHEPKNRDEVLGQSVECVSVMIQTLQSYV